MARVLIVGLRRGLVLARWCARAGFDVAALCDADPELLAAASAEFPEARTASSWQQLVTADVAAVVLAHDFDAHAEPALAFLERGVHVLSECAACVTEEEGRALVRAAEQSSADYSFAENYVEHPHVRTVARLVADGEIGSVELIECDYVHGLAPQDVAALAGDPAHWRGRISPTAYCTHTLSPVLDVTGARPVEVTAHPVGAGERPMAVVLATRCRRGRWRSPGRRSSRANRTATGRGCRYAAAGGSRSRCARRARSPGRYGCATSRGHTAVRCATRCAARRGRCCTARRSPPPKRARPKSSRRSGAR